MILILMYADSLDKGADFEKSGRLSNELLGLPDEDLDEVVARIVRP